MKTRIITFLTLLGFACVSPSFHSCNKIKDLAKFDVTRSLPTVHVAITKAVKSSMTEQYYEFSQYVNIDSIKSAHNLSNLSLENGKVTEVKITITAPLTANLSFLNTARVTLLNPGVNELQVAHTGIIDPNAKSIELVLDAVDITSFLNSQHFKGRLYYDITNSAMSDPIIYLGLDSTVKFTVSPL